MADAMREKGLHHACNNHVEKPHEHRPMQCKGVHECLDHASTAVHKTPVVERYLQPDSKTKEQTDSAAGIFGERECRDQMLGLSP